MPSARPSTRGDSKPPSLEKSGAITTSSLEIFGSPKLASQLHCLLSATVTSRSHVFRTATTSNTTTVPTRSLKAVDVGPK